jgi:hypothetical protein
MTQLLDSNHKPLFNSGSVYNNLIGPPKIGFLKTDVKQTSEIMMHPIETGVLISDHKVIQPIEIIMSVLINSSWYSDVYKIIETAFHSSTIINIQTNTGLYPNMVLYELPHRESPGHFDSIISELKFRQALIATPTTFKVNKQTHAKLSKKIIKGAVQGTSVTKPDIAQRLVTWVEGTSR